MPSLVETCPVVLKQKFFLIFSIYFYYLLLIPIRKGVGLYLNKFESPLPKDVLCQVWFKLTKLF